MELRGINEDLKEAIEFHNVEAVHDCLKRGADPNCVWPMLSESPENQPTTPLRMVIFRISDNLLEDSDLKQFAEIATLLLNYGADAKPAMQLAELRYGEYDPKTEDSPFMDVWRIVATGSATN